MIQVGGGDGWNSGSSSTGDEEWADKEYILKV